MRNLKFEEVQEVNGAGWLGELWDDARRIVNEAADAHQDAVTAVVDIACNITNEC